MRTDRCKLEIPVGINAGIEVGKCYNVEIHYGGIVIHADMVAADDSGDIVLRTYECSNVKYGLAHEPLISIGVDVGCGEDFTGVMPVEYCRRNE